MAIADDMEETINQAEQTLLNFAQHDMNQLELAIGVLTEYETPEYFEIDRIGEDKESSGFYQRYHFRKLGLVVEKKEETIINVHKSK